MIQHQVHTTHHFLLPFTTQHKHLKLTPLGYTVTSTTTSNKGSSSSNILHSILPLPTITTFPSKHYTLHNNGLDACGVTHIDTPAVKQHASQTEMVLGEYVPTLASPINCNDKYGNEAGVHELTHTELLTHSPS